MSVYTLNESRTVLLQKRDAWIQVLEIAQRSLPELEEEALMRIEGIQTALQLLGEYIMSNPYRERRETND